MQKKFGLLFFCCTFASDKHETQTQNTHIMKSNYTICHEFATGNKNESHGNHIYFTSFDGGRTLYSYGRHFAISRITPDGVCFFTIRSYSVTTAKHISEARGALSHYDLILCPYPDEYGPQLNFEYWQNELQSLERQLTTARNKARRINEITGFLNQIERFCGATGYKLPDYYAHFAEIVERGAASPEIIEQMKQARARARREAIEAAAARAERVREWESGERETLPYTDTESNVPLRIEERKGYKIVVTAKGVPVTIAAALKFYDALKAGELHPWQTIDTGGARFTIRDITKEKIQICCHTFKIAYLDAFRAKLPATA